MKQFCFFEIMTLASFAYVPNDESEYAKKASFSYLAYGIAGGLVMLYGLMLLYYTFSSWDLTSIRMAWQFNRNDPGVQRNLYIAGACLLFGYGAKAGMFPSIPGCRIRIRRHRRWERLCSRRFCQKPEFMALC